MKKLIVFLMCLAITAASAFAFDAKFIDNSGEPDNPEGYSRTYDTPCGFNQTPIEQPDNNNHCYSPDPTELGCGDQIFAWASTTSHDYYRVCVPANNTFVVRLRDCNGNLIPVEQVYGAEEGVKMIAKSNNCSDAISDWSWDDIELQNVTDDELCVIIKVVRYRENNTRCHDVSYRLVVTCNPITDPCPPGTRNYCEDPIIIPAGLPLVDDKYHYENVENTASAMDILDGIWEGGFNNECGVGFLYASGRDVVYELNLSQETELRIETGIPGGGDTQFMIATDCSDPHGTCILSCDKCQSNNFNDPEIVEGLILQAGVYYIFVSKYYTEDSCDDLYIIIDGDHELPVELTGFDAIAGDGTVTLNWSTASESNSDRYDIVRDGTTVGRVEADNYATGSNYSWTETDLVNGHTYSYELVAIDLDGSMETIGEVSATPVFNGATVSEYALHQNYPNPFNPETSISFDLADASQVSLTVFNPLGQTVATLVNGSLASGRHTVTFDGANLTSGLYYYRLEAGDFSAIRKMVLMK